MSAKMADRRRRRRVKSNEDSEEYSEESGDEQEVDKISEAGSVDESKEPVLVDSEYESAEEEKTTDKKGNEKELNCSEELVEIKESSPIPQTEVVLEHGLDAEECEEINAIGEEGGVEEAADETLIDGEVVQDGEYEEEEEDDDDEEEDEEIDEEGENEEQQEWKEGERQQGDGQESQQQLKEKVLDDDEDKRNPQYIPKKGGFYEHDDRLGDDEEREEEEKEEEKDKKGNKKKLWREDNTWQHDRFNENDQKPKSKDELVNAYGYDIRNEDDAPRARRRRRFTGPAKYTRRWNDEAAYIKTNSKWIGPEIGRRGGGGRGRGIVGVRRGWNRFPGGNTGDRIGNKSQMGFRPRPFNNNNRDMNEKNGDLNAEDETHKTVRSSHSESEIEEISETKSTHVSGETALNPQNFPPLTKEEDRPKSPTIVHESKSSGEMPRYEKPVRIEVRPRGGGRGGGIIRRGGGDRRAFSSNLRKDGRKYNNNDSGSEGSTNRHPSGGGNIEQRRQVTVPPRLQEAAASNRPKRYSSQRQRNAPIGYQQRSPPPNAAPLPPRFYDHGVEYHSSVPESNYQQPMYPDAAPNPPPQNNGPMIPPSPQPFTGYTPGFQEPYAIRPMASPPRIYVPTGTMPVSSPYMNYVPPPTNYPPYTFPPQPPPPPAYSSAPPTVVCTTTILRSEIVVENQLWPENQCYTTNLFLSRKMILGQSTQEFYRDGITYYNTQSQHYPPARNHLRRPKAAIPIVPPPDLKDNEDNEDGIDDGDEKSIDNDIDAVIDDSIHSAEVAVEG
uniref:Protein CASC3 n=1 Tax=Strigamia maritima TaxID=126957 RepID=T1JHM7_STRMM